MCFFVCLIFFKIYFVSRIIRMSLKAFPISKSVGFVLTKRYCIYDELIAFCCQKRIDFMPECDDHGYYGVFRIHMFSLEDALHVIEFIRRRNLNAVFVNMLWSCTMPNGKTCITWKVCSAEWSLESTCQKLFCMCGNFGRCSESHCADCGCLKINFVKSYR